MSLGKALRGTQQQSSKKFDDQDALSLKAGASDEDESHLRTKTQETKGSVVKKKTLKQVQRSMSFVGRPVASKEFASPTNLQKTFGKTKNEHKRMRSIGGSSVALLKFKPSLDETS